MKSTALPTNLKDWLAHRSALPPKNKGRGMKKVSSRRSKQLAEYRAIRSDLLTRFPWCMAWRAIHGWVLDNGGRSFERGRSVELHHIAGRIGAKLTDPKNLLPVSRFCHDWIHSNPSAARKLGLLR